MEAKIETKTNSKETEDTSLIACLLGWAIVIGVLVLIGPLWVIAIILFLGFS